MAARQLVLFCLVAMLAMASATTYFKETFDKDWSSRWVVSDWKKSDGTQGSWSHTAGPFYGDAEADKGIQTSQDARFYAISTKFPKFSNAGKDLVLQFQIRFPQKIDCGGGYIKLLSSTFDQKTFGGDTPYAIMFGPDICGTSTQRVHAIFGFQGKNLLIKKDIRCETDELSHVYTLIVRPDNTYEVRVDGTKRESGSLYDDWEFTQPKTIKDPSAKKPSDWDDRAKIDDPTDTKPAGHDKVPKEIPDPEAEKPADWDDEADGAWEAPTIPNPEWKGEWKPRQIDNPNYKGTWVHPEVPNPDYVEHKDVYKYSDIGGVGIEIWQVKAGTIFDNILVADSVSDAEAFMAETYTKQKAAEKKMFEAADEEKKEEEKKQREAVEEERNKQDKDGGDAAGDDADDAADDDDDDKGTHDDL